MEGWVLEKIKKGDVFLGAGVVGFWGRLQEVGGQKVM